MFVKMTIKEYMAQENVSRTTVENRIKNGDLESIKEGRNRYVKVYKPCKPEFVQSLQTPLQTSLYQKDKKNDYTQELMATIKEQKKEIKQLKKELRKEIKFSRKEIQRLIQKNEELNQTIQKEKDESITILKQFIGEMKLLSQNQPQKEDEIVVNSKKKKGNKRSSKSKKNKKSSNM